MNEDIQLADLLESYPPVTTPEFQTLITAKKEFNELASNPNEKLPPGRGNLYKHQLFTRRFLRAYDRLMILSETGTGKSCEALGFIEYTRHEMEKAKTNPNMADEKAAHFKQVIILVRGETLRNEITQQIVCKCSDGRYEPEVNPEDKREGDQKRRVTNAVKKAGYRVKPYTMFANAIAREIDEKGLDQVSKDYSDTIFWFDEAHNLLINSKDKKMTEKQRTYQTLWTLLHVTLRTKIILSTATPMINTDHEFGSLFNLLLPENGKPPLDLNLSLMTLNDRRVLFPTLPADVDLSQVSLQDVAPYFQGQFPKDFNFADATLRDLEPFLRGRVGYVRAPETGAIPEQVGSRIQEVYEVNGVSYQSQMVLYTSQMSEFQNEGYLRAVQSRSQQSEVFASERQASNFIFPDGYWGGGATEREKARQKAVRRARKQLEEPQLELTPTADIPQGGIIPVMIGSEATAEVPPQERRAFRRYVTATQSGYAATPEFLPWISNLAYIRTLSCKYYWILKHAIEDSGNVFIYGEYAEGSGAVVLGLCLEALGFEKYDESSSMFVGAGGVTNKPYCSSGQDKASERRVREGFKSYSEGGPPRYALLTGGTSDTKFQSMMEAMNSYENRHGDYIKVLISTRVGRDGINVNNVLQIHLVGAEWNESTMHQAISRGIRATSHEDILNEERARLLQIGQDPRNAQVIVNIYRHAAISPTEQNASVDMHMYRTAEHKDRAIKRVMRMLKQCSVGCQVHYQRNVREGPEMDGTAACDYDVCQYTCVDPAPTGIDYSTYDVLYADEVVDQALEDIVNAFRQNNALSLEQMETLFPQYRRKYLVMALEELVIKKIKLVDRFGYTSFLREDQGSFYLVRSYPGDENPQYAMQYYTEGVIAIQERTLSEVVSRSESEQYASNVERLENMDPRSEEFDDYLNNLSIDGQAILVEDVLSRYANGERSPYIETVMDKFARFIAIFREPVNMIEKEVEAQAPGRPRKGRPRKAENIGKSRKIDIDKFQRELVEDPNNEIVYLHGIYAQTAGLTEYNTTSRYNNAEGRFRILKPSENESWRDLDLIESIVYQKRIMLDRRQRQNPYEEQMIYGFIEKDKFKIRDRTTETAQAATDKRSKNRGKVCVYFDKPILIDIAWKIDIPTPPGIYTEYEAADDETLRNILRREKSFQLPEKENELRTWDRNRLLYYVKWLRGGGTKVNICDDIRQHMETTNRMMNQ